MTEAGEGAGGFAVYTKFMPRIRHARGYGIHSPLVYSLIREVFMKKEIGEDRLLYDEMMKTGAKAKTARDLQNLYNFYGFSDFSVNGAGASASGGNRLHILSGAGVPELLEEINSIDWEMGNVLCLVPGRSKEFKSSCRDIAGRHSGISIDRKRYFLYYLNASYAKQHYKL